MKLTDVRKGRVGIKFNYHGGVTMLNLEEWKVLAALSESAISIIENGDAGEEE